MYASEEDYIEIVKILVEQEGIDSSARIFNCFCQNLFQLFDVSKSYMEII